MSHVLTDELFDLILENDRAIAALDPTDFGERFRLSMRGDELRSELRHRQAEQLAIANAEWAERAGRKGEHQEVDPEVAAQMLNKFMDGGIG